jgi:DivIVA domain-containing protein
MDRQAIERRDFPIARRGYDPASVDAHLRALAGEIEQLRRQVGGIGRDSLAASAGAQVQSILEAAQATAQAIESEAAEQATAARHAAAEDARRTREQAVARAQERVSAVTQATEALLQRVGSMDGETRTLIESLRGGAGRLVTDLEGLSVEMGALYDAAAGRSSGSASATPVPGDVQPVATSADIPTQNGAASDLDDVPAPAQPTPVTTRPNLTPSVAPIEQSPLTLASEQDAAPSSDDLDGARLVALNMALNGDSREAADRYLAENFDVPDRERLLDEVYAAIEG